MTNSTFDIIKTISSINNYAGRVIEFGSAIFNDTKFNLRTIIKHDKYIGIDMSDGMGVDIISNLHKINLPGNCADVIICSSVLEHDDAPIGTIMEMKRLIKNGGKILITVPFNWAIHCYPDDYWRITPSGMKVILKEYFDDVQTFGVGEENNPHTTIGLVNNSISDHIIAEINKKWKFEEGLFKGIIRQSLPEPVFKMVKKCKKMIFA